MAFIGIGIGVINNQAVVDGGLTPIADPTQISGNVAWYDASDTAVGHVAQWNDKSGNNNHAVQSNPSLQPLCGDPDFYMNGNKTLIFSNFELNLPSSLHSLSAGDNTVLITTYNAEAIFGGSGGANGYRIFSGTVSSNPAWCIIHNRVSSPRLEYINDSSFSFIDTNRELNTFVPTTIGLTFDGANQVQGIYNGEIDSGSGSPVTVDSLKLGEFYPGVLGEVVIYDRLLSASELNQLGNYFTIKWGTPWANIV